MEKYEKYFIPEKEGEYKIELRFDINLTDCSYMFSGCENIKYIHFTNFNTSNVKDMSHIFYHHFHHNNNYLRNKYFYLHHFYLYEL